MILVQTILPLFAAPRDFCLLRYWRDNSDGSYVICLDSTNHAECPPVEGYVRGEMHAAYIIAPPRKGLGPSNAKDDDEELNECMISFIAQVDPKGWIWQLCGYQQTFLREVSFTDLYVVSLFHKPPSLCCKRWIFVTL